MPDFPLGSEECLHYEHEPPKARRGWTFVFFNDLTSDCGLWEAAVAPALRRAGHGTLVWNYRGQSGSRCNPDSPLSVDALAGNAVRLLASLVPARPVLVGLSLGGVLACRALMAGAEARALVLINAVRSDGPRQRWIDDAMVRCLALGGAELVVDLYAPLLYNEEWLAAHRPGPLKRRPYRPPEETEASFRLYAEAGTADWQLPYDRLKLPTLVITGLQDRLFVDPDDLERLAARLPDGRRLELHNAGHFVPVERPQQLTQALTDLVEKRLAAAP
jgi:pimeloyl-ACP methyl ester carboxylesterase